MAGLQDDLDDAALDDLFAVAKAAQPVASAALMARIAVDAAAVQRSFSVPLQPAPLRSGRITLLARLIGAVGGGGALAGLATATLAGFWIGLAQPVDLSTVSDRLWPAAGADTVELIPTFDEVLSDVEG